MTNEEEKIITFLEDICKKTGYEVSSEKFYERLPRELKRCPQKIDFDNALELAYSKVMKPSEFYFALVRFEDADVAIITPKRKWDEEGFLDDTSISDYIVPPFLEQITDAHYEWQDLTKEEVRKQLIQLGFVENKELGKLEQEDPEDQEDQED